MYVEVETILRLAAVDQFVERTAPVSERNLTMSALRNLPIARKFTLAFSLVCILCIGLGTYSFLTFRGVTYKSNEVTNDDFPSVVQLNAVLSAIHAVRESDLGSLLCSVPACAVEAGARRRSGLAAYDAADKAYQPFVTSDGERTMTQKMESAFSQYVEFSNRTAASLAGGKTGDALDTLTSDSANTAFGAMSKKASWIWRAPPRQAAGPPGSTPGQPC
jgi:methyl-accepting chemotaxis protein